MENFKTQVLELILNNYNIFNWVRDKKDYEFRCEVNKNLIFRIAATREGTYLQIMRSCTDYQIYDAKEFPQVKKLMDKLHENWVNKKNEVFFKNVYDELSTIING